jgi:L-ascorbate metabolism protein UlaG (beta-lactamase superfamily)
MTTAPAPETTRRLTWLGHSTVLIELDGMTVLTDPVLRRRVAHLLRPRSFVPPRLPQLDLVLVSHVHFDHLDLRSLADLGRRVPLVVPRGAGKLLVGRGFTDVTEVVEGSEVTLDGFRVHVTHAEHDAHRGPFGVKAPPVGYVVRGSRNVYFAGDTDLFAGMASLGTDLDVALLPVAGWGPRLPPGHLDAAGAAEAVRRLRPRLAVPIHWGTYKPFYARAHAAQAPGEAFAEHVHALTLNVEVRVLQPGGGLEL